MNAFYKIGCAAFVCLSISACTSTSTTKNAEKAAAKQSLDEKTADVTETKTATLTTTDGSVKVCKRTQQTGSRFKTKVCMTKAEWDAISEKSRKTTGGVQRRSGQQSNPTGGQLIAKMTF